MLLPRDVSRSEQRGSAVLELRCLAVARFERFAECARGARRLADREGRREAEHGVADRGHPAVAAAEGGEVDLGVADLRGRLVAVREADVRTVNSEPFAEQRLELAEHAAFVAPEDPPERVGLLV